MAMTPIHVFACWKVKAGNMPAVLKLLKEVYSKTIRERGNLFYRIHQSLDANTVVIFEGYTDEATQKEHRASDHFKNLVVDKIFPLLEEREVILTTPVEC